MREHKRERRQQLKQLKKGYDTLKKTNCDVKNLQERSDAKIRASYLAHLQKQGLQGEMPFSEGKSIANTLAQSVIGSQPTSPKSGVTEF